MRKFLVTILLLSAGCVAPPQAPPPAPPAAARAEAALPFEAWRIVDSRLEVRVYRAGPMQQFGHDHLITSDALSGAIELREPRAASTFTLALPLGSLVVDDATLRAAAGGGFAAPVPDRDRDATRRNLLGPAVLDAARQPVLRLTADRIETRRDGFTAQLRIGLRGEERVLEVPFTVAFTAQRMRIHASLRMRHADLGLAPFTVALGALSVRDDFEIDCRLEAERTT